MKKILISMILLCVIACSACQGETASTEDPAAGLMLTVEKAAASAEDGKTTISYTVSNKGKETWKIGETISLAAKNDKNEWTDMELNQEFTPASTKLQPNVSISLEWTGDVVLESGITYRLSVTLENTSSGEPAELTAEFTAED